MYRQKDKLGNIGILEDPHLEGFVGRFELCNLEVLLVDARPEVLHQGPVRRVVLQNRYCDQPFVSETTRCVSNDFIEINDS